MRVLWPHTFWPHVPSAGHFMNLLAAGMRERGIVVDLLYLGNLRRPRTLLSARRVVQRLAGQYDLVHAQFGSACAFVTSAAPGPKVVTLRGSDWHRYRGPVISEWRAAALATAFSRASINRFDTVVTMSNRMTESVRRIARHPRVVAIPDPIDTLAFRPVERTPDPDKRSARVLFTTISRSNPVKRVQLAEQAVKVASSRIESVELSVASGIPHDRMPSFVASCDVALCTSTHEGWPNSIKEALACGIPFVSTDVSDLAAVAREYGTCRICPPDPEALGNALCEVLSEPRDANLPRAVESMDVARTSARLIEVYEDVLRGGE